MLTGIQRIDFCLWTDRVWKDFYNLGVLILGWLKRAASEGL